MPDWLRSFYCNSPCANLLSHNRRDLSIKNSRVGRGDGCHIRLGLEPVGLTHVSDVGRETRRELNVSALCVCVGGVVALCLLSGSGNERPHVGRDRSILENGSSPSPDAQLKLLV